jgi:hypothetical protein
MSKPSLLKRILKWTGAIMVVLVLLFLLIVGPWPVNRSPLEKGDYYQSSLESIERTLSTQVPPAPLRAGFASVKLDLPQGLPLSGYGARRGAASTGTHDPIRAKAMVLASGDRRVAFMDTDMLLINANLARKVQEKLASETPFDLLYYTATHSHSGPGGWGTWWAENLIAGETSPEGIEVIADGMAEAVRLAAADLKPATLSYGKALVPKFIKNRLLSESPVDPSLQTLRFTGEGGAYLGAIVSFPAHATVMGADNLLFSAEYPGFLERALEEAWGGPAFFCAGPMGSMSPTGGKGEGFDRAAFIGEGLAQEAIELIESGGFRTVSSNPSVMAVKVPIKTPPVQYRVKENLRLAPVLCNLLLDFNRDVTFNVLKIGPLLMVGLPCELSGEIALELYDYAQERGLHLMLTSFNGNYVGYIVPDKYYPLDKYETRGMNFLGPYGGSYFESTLKKVIDELGTQSTT